MCTCCVYTIYTALPLVINDWNLRILHISDIQCMIFVIFSMFGNVILFIPIIWKNKLCFKNDNNEENILLNHKYLNDGNDINSLWQTRKINGMIWDFQFIRYNLNNERSININFVVLYSQKDRNKILSDSIELFEKKRENKNNKLIINDISNIKITSIFDDNNKIDFNLKEQDKNKLYLIPMSLSNKNAQTLQNLLNTNYILMRMSHENSINIEILKRIIQNEILVRNNKKILNENSVKIMYNAFENLFQNKLLF